MKYRISASINMVVESSDLPAILGIIASSLCTSGLRIEPAGPRVRQRLTEEQRKAIVSMSLDEARSASEIAAETGASVTTVRRVLHAHRSLIRSHE